MDLGAWSRCLLVTVTECCDCIDSYRLYINIAMSPCHAIMHRHTILAVQGTTEQLNTLKIV